MTLTSTGFTRPRLAEIKADYDQKFTDALGPVNTGADAVVGQIIGIFSAALDDAYEALQDNYDAMYPGSAEDTSLDGAVSFVGLQRLGATATTAVGVCYGTEGTLIPAGATATALDGNTYATEADMVISRSSVTDCDITVITITNNATYQVIAGGVAVTFTSDPTATGAEIAAGLAALFDSDLYTATTSGAVLSLRAKDGKSAFTLTVDSKLTISKIGTPAGFVCTETGAVALPIGALSSISTAISGWGAVNNLAAGATGQAVETDAELRIRHTESTRVSGAATVQAIRSRILQEVDSVSYVAVYENRTAAVDSDGLPAHAVQVVVSGGSDSAIGDKLWEVKPASIETYGAVTVAVTDDNGDAQSVSFSRATTKYAWIRVSVNVLYPEETLTESAATAIRTAVLTTGQAQSVGEDIITQRYFGPIYSATSGIGSITVEAAITDAATDTPSYTTANVPVGRTSLAAFDSARITVVGV